MYRIIIISLLLLTSPITMEQSLVLEDTIYDGVGLVIENQSDVLVRNNEFRNLGGISPMAIKVSNSNNITIQANIISDITPHPLSDAYGIFIYNSHNVRIVDNNLTRIQAEESPTYGIYIVDSTDITVSGNSISHLGNISSYEIKVENSELVIIENNRIEHLYEGNPISVHSTKRLSVRRNEEISSSISVFHNISEFEFRLNSWKGQIKISDSINGLMEMDEYFYPNHTLSIVGCELVRIENNDFIGVSSNFLDLKENREVYYIDNRQNLTVSPDIKVELLDHNQSIATNTTEKIWDVSMIYNFSMIVEITNSSDGSFFTKTLQSVKLNASELTVKLDWEDVPPWSAFNVTVNITDYYNNTYSSTTSMSLDIRIIETDNPVIENGGNSWYLVPIILLVIIILAVGIRKKTRVDRTVLAE